jgi:hypothetical protein
MNKTLAAILSGLLMVGCGAAEVAESDLDVGADTDDLTAPQKVLGSWKATDGTLLGLTLAKVGTAKKFVGEQQVWCFRAPCHPVHLSGTWTAAGKRVTLTESGNKHSYEFSIAGEVMTLKEYKAPHQLVGHLTKVATWCAQTADCGLQQWPHPMCMGGPVCTAAQACGWHCGGIPFPGGYGDECGNGVGCSAQLACEISGPAATTGTCWPTDKCSPTAWRNCGDTLVCAVASDGTGTCKPFAHGQVVGQGYSCGGSIGVSCATGLTCSAPTGVIGGTGTCN